MDQVFNDPTVLEGCILEKNRLGARSAADIRIQALDWVEGADYPVAQSLSIGQLANSQPPLRIIFPQSAQDDGVLWLVQHYSIPTAFLEGEYRAVTHSFGSLDSDDGYRCCWFNYLCKNITVTPGPEPVIADPRFKDKNQDTIRQSVTLICFGGQMVINRLQTLTYSAVKNGIIHDPLSLFVVILNRLSAHMNNAVWDLSKVFAGIEIKALGLNHDRESFTGLHNISKHVIFLQESSEAALETVKNLARHHQDLSPRTTYEDQAAGQATRRTIAQVEAEFKGVKLRLRSLDRRMQNVIALSFHLVTQEGNEFLQADSNTMATIAFVTLVFLPITTVSTIFGSQFFNVTDDNSAIEVSKDFWIFWVVSIPLTLIVLLGWTLWRKHGLVASHAAWMRALRPFAQEKGAS